MGDEIIIGCYGRDYVMGSVGTAKVFALNDPWYLPALFLLLLLLLHLLCIFHTSYLSIIYNIILACLVEYSGIHHHTIYVTSDRQSDS